MRSGLSPQERRLHPRMHLGVPVRVHYAGEVRTLTLELTNVSATGCYFKTSGRHPRVGQWVAFGSRRIARSAPLAAERCAVTTTDLQ